MDGQKIAMVKQTLSINTIKESNKTEYKLYVDCYFLAELKIKDPVNGTVITKQTSLTLTFFNEDELINQNEADLDVYAQYFRVKRTEVIDEARKACEQNKNEDAQKLIDNMLIQIQKNPNVAAQCTGIIQDLHHIVYLDRNKCVKWSGGVNSLFSAQGMQLQQVQPAAYQNVQQQQMMFQVQNQKPNCRQY
ncbi:unnamed protein product [Paramecium pentaurelia]|uniref:Uncharacterized protein n=1 Tax=Paramecium pentaurelia TaxID=43138 RepID=A0A8S1TIZ5_9CILI|nr:unnamed protein product [Paramecium pentaurelia]